MADITTKFGDAYHRSVIACMEKSEACGSLQIVQKPKGTEQDEEYEAFKSVFVNQTTNGGYSGDSFAGEVYIPLPDGTFLEVPYSM